ncbi:hypothetical protein HZI73_19345 [Vallitalea pronyensis]|uniref:Uncharacterized protein n=1 Tax=Vallitalea pronyensis TaxID=1348613 RepID=A0A8J8MN56_9FIRM|nr:hypothetical protein [Vallitalea pronyensis]QUI24318.1 hypothetical protein HZI73_19345 [Vallitalea pronyensis]
MMTYSNNRRIYRYPKSSCIHLPWHDGVMKFYHPLSQFLLEEWQDIELKSRKTSKKISLMNR